MLLRGLERNPPLGNERLGMPFKGAVDETDHYVKNIDNCQLI